MEAGSSWSARVNKGKCIVAGRKIQWFEFLDFSIRTSKISLPTWPCCKISLNCCSKWNLDVSSHTVHNALGCNNGKFWFLDTDTNTAYMYWISVDWRYWRQSPLLVVTLAMAFSILTLSTSVSAPLTLSYEIFLSLNVVLTCYCSLLSKKQNLLV